MMFSKLFSRSTAAIVLRGSKISPSRLLSSFRPNLPSDDEASASQSANTAAAQAVLPDDDASKRQSDTSNNVFELIRAHQESAARLPTVDVVRTQVQHSRWGMFFTKDGDTAVISKEYIACDPDGCPILSIKNDSRHAKGLRADPNCIFIVCIHPGGKDRRNLSINMEGVATVVSIVSGNEYLVEQPNPFRVDSGDRDSGEHDFQVVRFEPNVVQYKFMLGFPKDFPKLDEQFSKEQYKAARVDMVSPYCKPIADHMNKHHAEDLKVIVQHSTSIPVDYAQMLDCVLDFDSLGFGVKAGYQGHTFDLRIPFPRRAEDIGDVNFVFGEMVHAARAHSS